MNKAIFERKWKQVRGEIRGWWGQFTDEELDKVAGQFDVFIGLLRQKYGYSRVRAVREIDKLVAEYDAQRNKHIPEL